MNPIPVELIRDANQLQIKWNDAHVQTFSVKTLRDACPCARCMETKSKTNVDTESDTKAAQPNLLRVLSVAETQPLRIIAMKPVGNYAYHVEFSDGHNTGIYTFGLLRDLGET